MHDYPPEYDELCVLNIPAPELPDWLDPNIYWDEDGRVFVMRKADGSVIELIAEVEATDDYDADLVAVKAQALARLDDYVA